MPASPRLIAGLSNSASAGPIGCTSGLEALELGALELGALEFGALDFGALSPDFFGEVGVFAMSGIWDESAAEKRVMDAFGTPRSTACRVVSSCQRLAVIPGLDASHRPGMTKSVRPSKIYLHFSSIIVSRTPMPDINPKAGKPVEPSMLVNVPRLVTAYFAGKPDPGGRRRSASRSAPRAIAARRFDNAFNEAHILAISQAICDHRRERRHHRPAVHRHRHPRAVRARAGQRARSVRRQRRRGDDRRARRLHADAGHLARDPDLQQGPQERPRRRRRHHARRTIRPRMAASNTIRRTAARPIPTSPAGSSAPRTLCSKHESRRRAAHPVRARAQSSPACIGTTTSGPMSPTSATSSTWRRSARPA